MTEPIIVSLAARGRSRIRAFAPPLAMPKTRLLECLSDFHHGLLGHKTDIGLAESLAAEVIEPTRRRYKRQIFQKYAAPTVFVLLNRIDRGQLADRDSQLKRVLAHALRRKEAHNEDWAQQTLSVW